MIESITAALQTQIGAWNRGSLLEFCSWYSDDVVFLSPVETTRGRDALLARYRRQYPDRAAMGTLTLEFEDIRPGPLGGSATVAASWRIERDGGGASSGGGASATGGTLLVLHAMKGRWWIVQDASWPTSPPRTPGG
ncbi:MAG: nuclear transport factor 2 family protein [Deltaproteobacteria bacterium]|nr:nuclear transport factor 2 family protein [Deltaproteobacteria bacterium]